MLPVNSGRGMSDESESAVVPITLTSDYVTGLAITTTTRPATIAGQLMVEGGQGAALKSSDFSFFTVPVDPVSPIFGRSFTLEDDWTFEGGA